MSHKYSLLIALAFLITNPITADTVIDGGGNRLTLTRTSTLTVPVTSKLTLKNLTLTGLKDERLRMMDGTSKLVLDNATVLLDGDYTFSQGSIEIINNSSIEGEHIFTCSSHNIMVHSGATFRIGNNTTFICTPTRGINTPIRFEDDEARLLLDSATFKNSNIGFTGENNGLIFSGGVFEIDGTSIIDHVGTTTDTALAVGTGFGGSGDCKLYIRPHAKLIVKRAGLLYKGTGSGSLNTSGNLGTIEERDGGNFLIDSSNTPVASTGINVRSSMNLIGENTLTLDKNRLDIDTSKIAGQTTSGNITDFSDSDLLGGLDTGETFRSATFSPDGKYVVAGSSGLFSAFSFDPTSGTPLTQIGTTATSGNGYSASFSPDGKYVVVGLSSDFGAGSEIRVYTFDGTSATPFTEIGTGISLPSGYNGRHVDFSPDGRYVAAGLKPQVGTPGTEVRIYTFDPTSATPLTEIGTGAETGDERATWVKFSPNGKYLVASLDSGTGEELRVYNFDPTSATPATEIGTGIEFGASGSTAEFSPDGKYVVAGLGSGSDRLRAYSFDPTSATPFTQIGTLDSGTATIGSVNFSPDGKNVAIGLWSDSGASDVRIYNFDPTSANPFGTSTSGIGTGAEIGTQAWKARFSPNGKYIVVACSSSANPDIRVYEPTRGTKTAVLDVTDGTMKLKQDIELTNVTLQTS